tara:strand:- start:160 stop:750 length:591 start_codon:yes stop_codon:yes gene_type:complete
MKRLLLLLFIPIFSFSQTYDDIKVYKGGDYYIEGEYPKLEESSFEKIPSSLYKEIEKRNLDIYQIIPEEKIITDSYNYYYTKEEFKECMEKDDFFGNSDNFIALSGSVEIQTPYFANMYPLVKGFVSSARGFVMYDVWRKERFKEPHPSNLKLLENYLKENFSYEQMLGWHCSNKKWYNILLENLDLWSFIDQLPD